MTKPGIVYNARYGGLGLSDAAIARGREISGNENWGKEFLWEIARHDPVLVAVVRELGDAANDWCSKLKVRDVESGRHYRIEEHGGRETIIFEGEDDWEVVP